MERVSHFLCIYQLHKDQPFFPYVGYFMPLVCAYDYLFAFFVYVRARVCVRENLLLCIDSKILLFELWYAARPCVCQREKVYFQLYSYRSQGIHNGYASSVRRLWLYIHILHAQQQNVNISFRAGENTCLTQTTMDERREREITEARRKPFFFLFLAKPSKKSSCCRLSVQM